MHDSRRHTLSIVAGVISPLLVALTLWPIVKIIFDIFFHLYLFTTPPKDAWKDDLVIQITFMFWFLISSIAGGIICRLISTNKRSSAIIICSVVLVSVLQILSRGEILREGWKNWLVILMIPAGFFSGNFLALTLKAKQQK